MIDGNQTIKSELFGPDCPYVSIGAMARAIAKLPGTPYVGRDQSLTSLIGQVCRGSRRLPGRLSPLIDQVVVQACADKGWHDQTDDWVNIYRMRLTNPIPPPKRGRPAKCPQLALLECLARASREELDLAHRVAGLLLREPGLIDLANQRFLHLVGTLLATGTVPTDDLLQALYDQAKGEIA